jgi:acetolactate synthase-1/2/3 large subunit
VSSSLANLLLVSGLGDDTGGGLFLIEGNAVQQIDRVSTTGLAIRPTQFARLLWSPDDANAVGEVLIYDVRGVEKYFRIDTLREPHSVVWQGQTLVMVSTGTNELLWISPEGRTTNRWRAPGDDDSWHLNSLVTSCGDLLVCAFSRQTKHQAWASDLHEPRGVLINVRTCEEVLSGLITPHNPTRVDDTWLMCWSVTHQLVEVSLCGQVTRVLTLDGWTRGLAVHGDIAFVGVSAHRYDRQRGSTSHIAVVDRHRWKVLGRIELPCREVYDIALVDDNLVRGARLGFKTNPHRLAERDQFVLFDEIGVRAPRLWAVGEIPCP